MEYTIYQVKDTNPDGRMFMNADWLAKNGLKATKDAYNRVYSGEVESFEPLEYLWKKFNMAHPDDYRGRSLSVSDVVVLTDENGAKAFFCDSFGWNEVPEFLIEREIRKNGIFSIHVCPNHCEALLTTSAHVVQTWKVDALGNFVDEVSNDDIAAGPDDGNIWECEECGAEAEQIECQRFSIMDGPVQGDLYMPATPRGCAFWIARGMTAAKYIPIVPDEREIPCLTVEGKVFYLADINNA